MASWNVDLLVIAVMRDGLGVVYIMYATPAQFSQHVSDSANAQFVSLFSGSNLATRNRNIVALRRSIKKLISDTPRTALVKLIK